MSGTSALVEKRISNDDSEDEEEEEFVYTDYVSPWFTAFYAAH